MHAPIQVLWGDILKPIDIGEEPNKCNQCDFVSNVPGNVRRQFKTCSVESQKMQSMLLCILSSRRFEKTFINMQWGKVRQIQPIWFWFTFAMNMNLLKHNVENINKCNKCGFASSLADNLRTLQKTFSVEKKRDAVNKQVQATNQNVDRPGTLVKQGCLIVEATWFKQCKLVKPMYLGFQRLLA